MQYLRKGTLPVPYIVAPHMFTTLWNILLAVGLIGFSFLATFGSVLFALGSLFPDTAAILPLMLIGRLIFGAGNGSLTSEHVTRYGTL